VKVYYKCIQKLAHGLQVPTKNNFLTIVFRMGLQPYFGIATAWMKRSTLQHYKEVAMLCEKRYDYCRSNECIVNAIEYQTTSTNKTTK
jgi:hypothetical protein